MKLTTVLCFGTVFFLAVGGFPATASSASLGSAPTCRGVPATIYVEDGRVVGGPNAGRTYEGVLKGTGRADVLVGSDEDDRILAGGGDDLACGANGNDELKGSRGIDILDGGGGADKLKGGPGTDYCTNGRVHRCEPPSDYLPYRDLMVRATFLGPLVATGSSAVRRRALEDAETLLAMMLHYRTDVVDRLQLAGAVTAVFAKSESVCDLDYFADLAGQEICDTAVGGLGGVPGRPATACSEINVLRDPEDPFGRGTRPDGENVCVHELAHTIMNVGLSDEERQAIRVRFGEVLEDGLWTGDFAVTNADEFFAEMSQSYFCANPDIPAFLHLRGINCPRDLRSYDKDTFDLIDSIYRGSADLR